jgi:hypothetical protein
LLILLGDLTFTGKCIVSTSNKMQRYTVYLYRETALHVSGGIYTRHQARVQLYLQHLVFVTPLLPSDAIVEELEQTDVIMNEVLVSVNSIWYSSHRYCYLTLSWKSWNKQML